MRSCFLFLLFIFGGTICAQVQSIDTSITNASGKQYKTITYKTGKTRDSLVYLYEDAGRAVFIPRGSGSLGTWKHFSKEGYLDREYMVSNNLKNGQYLSYYPSGQVKQKEFYLEGMRTGNSTQYYEDGNTKLIAQYEDGRLLGTIKQYYRNGKLQWQGDYEKGRMKGERLYYDANGAPINGPFAIKDENGRTEREGTCVNGKPEGELKIYNDQGELIILSNFKEGKPHGLTYHYGKGHKLLGSELYKDGKFKKGTKIPREP